MADNSDPTTSVETPIPGSTPGRIMDFASMTRSNDLDFPDGDDDGEEPIGYVLLRPHSTGYEVAHSTVLSSIEECAFVAPVILHEGEDLSALKIGAVKVLGDVASLVMAMKKTS